eukprot:s1285_g9.t1
MASSRVSASLPADSGRDRSRSPQLVFQDSQDPLPVLDPVLELIMWDKINGWVSEQLAFPERFVEPGQDISSRICRMRALLLEGGAEDEEEKDEKNVAQSQQ